MSHTQSTPSGGVMTVVTARDVDIKLLYSLFKEDYDKNFLIKDSPV
jgi:hypothetical protein